jgi:IS30 family transposase
MLAVVRRNRSQFEASQECILRLRTVEYENTNGLLRQYFPRRTDLSGYTQADLDKVALRSNQRPRKTLGFQAPASKLQESVSSTG